MVGRLIFLSSVVSGEWLSSFLSCKILQFSVLWCSVNGAGLTHWLRLRLGHRARNVCCLEHGQTGRNRSVCLDEAKMSGEQASKGGGCDWFQQVFFFFKVYNYKSILNILF